MKDKDDKPERLAHLRSRAEEIVKQQSVQWPEDLATRSRDEALKLVHELRVHQIELTM